MNPTGITRATEQHYSVQQVAEMWGLSAEKVRLMFQDVEGVLKISFTGMSKKKRKPYVTLRIPASILEQFHQERSAGFRLKVR